MYVQGLGATGEQGRAWYGHGTQPLTLRLLIAERVIIDGASLGLGSELEPNSAGARVLGLCEFGGRPEVGKV